jgi:tetratricopeptide (TPR) repeat protein
MFFPRLRRHAKWVFVLLALIFGLGFVVFGVGAGGTGIGDILRGGGNSGGGSPSVKKALAATEKTPNDPAAWRELSTAYQTDGKNTEAIDALQRFTTLQPNDTDALRELAGLYLAEGSQKSYEANLARFVAVYNGGSGIFSPSLTGTNGRTVFSNKLAGEIDSRTSVRVQTLGGESSAAYGQAVAVYKQLAALSHGDPNVQIELAQAAQQAGDYAEALTAYKEYVTLAPDSSTAAAVKQQIKQLESALATAGGAGSK